MPEIYTKETIASPKGRAIPGFAVAASLRDVALHISDATTPNDDILRGLWGAVNALSSGPKKRSLFVSVA